MNDIAKQIAEQRETAIGRQQRRSAMIDPGGLAHFRAAIGLAPGEADLPPLVHWGWFGECVADNEIGPDGHPMPGDFLPRVAALPRRMFASTKVSFLAPLRLGAEARMVREIADVQAKQGSDGLLMFVTVDQRIEQDGAACIEERQTLVYRGGARSPLPSLPELRGDARSVPEGGALWEPTSISLFRFSAATFNSHRIHYDLDYARDVENYPALIVHGPFLAAKLALLATRRGPLGSLTFRASAPIFLGQPVRLIEIDPGHLRAIRCDGVAAVDVKVTY